MRSKPRNNENISKSDRAHTRKKIKEFSQATEYATFEEKRHLAKKEWAVKERDRRGYVCGIGREKGWRRKCVCPTRCSFLCLGGRLRAYKTAAVKAKSGQLHEHMPIIATEHEVYGTWCDTAQVVCFSLLFSVDRHTSSFSHRFSPMVLV